MRTIPAGSSTMDAVTIAEQDRAGGGAPNERRLSPHASRWDILKTALAARWPFRATPAASDGLAVRPAAAAPRPPAA
jgi:hypothetical protein